MCYVSQTPGELQTQIAETRLAIRDYKRTRRRAWLVLALLCLLTRLGIRKAREARIHWQDVFSECNYGLEHFRTNLGRLKSRGTTLSILLTNR